MNPFDNFISYRFLLAQSNSMARFLKLHTQNRFKIKLPITMNIDFVGLDFPHTGVNPISSPVFPWML